MPKRFNVDSQGHQLRGPEPAPQNIIIMQPERKKIRHGLHFILTVCTFGAWLPVWAILAIAR